MSVGSRLGGGVGGRGSLEGSGGESGNGLAGWNGGLDADGAWRGASKGAWESADERGHFVLWWSGR